MTIKGLAARAVGLPREHGLNPGFFLLLSLIGVSLRVLFYLPRAGGGGLPFLISLRVVSLCGPLYILLKGKGIAPLLNLSLLLGWSLKTAWEVCYFVFL